MERTTQANSPKTRPTVVLIGGFGWRDLGDEAMPQAVIAHLRAAVPAVDIVMPSPNPEYTRAYHGERSIPDVNAYLRRRPLLLKRLASRRLGLFGRIVERCLLDWGLFWARWAYFLLCARCRRAGLPLPAHRSGRDLLDALERTDLLFNNGGGNINSLLPGELYKQALMVLAARALGKPVILSGQTLGPFTSRFHGSLTRWALNGVEMITFRDREVSRERAARIGIVRPIMRDTGDDAVGLPAPSAHKMEAMIRENSGGSWLQTPAGITVVMNMNGYLKAMGKSHLDDYEREVALMSELAVRLIDRHRARIMLVPTDCGAGADDRPLLERLARRIDRPERVLPILREYGAAQYKGLIAQGDLAIGSRYHFSVFALSSAVPCIGLANGLYQKTKLRGVADLFGVTQCAVEEDMEHADVEKVWGLVAWALAEGPALRKRLRERSDAAHHETLITVRRACQLLAERRPA